MRAPAIALALLVATTAFAQNVRKDDLGREVVQAGAGKRIVSLAPHITEAVAAANAWPELVGVSDFSDFPPYVRSLPKVSGSAGIAWEKLAAVRPDIVFAWKDTLREGDLERFAQLKIPVYVIGGRRLSGVRK